MYNICGIQQIGIGCANVAASWKWYRQFFGMDVPVFNEEAEAKLMLRYTEGKPQARHAVLAVNMQGGGGFEIWQYTGRTPQPPAFDILWGDTGIYAAKIKTPDAEKSFSDFGEMDGEILSEEIEISPIGEKYFWMRDPFGNIFQIVEAKDWFQRNGKNTGGAYGAVIGTTQIDRMTEFFKDVLNYDVVAYKRKDVFHDTKCLPGGSNPCERVLLRHSAPRKGAFAPLLGASEIELVQVFDRTPRKIFENRLWGDLGFIHLCFDVRGMDGLQYKCTDAGFPFTVDTANSFDMGEAAGRFAYIEDPDGTLIEFVETHKVPILKPIGWYLDLTKRNPEKSLPRLVIQAMGLNRVRD